MKKLANSELSDILRDIAAIASPSGCERAIMQVLGKYVSGYVDLVAFDAIGNMVCSKYGNDAQANKTIMFVAHADEVGLMVSYIEESGYIRFTRIGGVDMMLLKGRNVKIIHNDAEVPGVIGAMPIHIRRNSNKDLEESDLWIDIGISGREEVEKVVSIGDYIVIDAPIIEMSDGLICSRGCDNKAGVVALLRMLELIKNLDCKTNIVVVFSVQEEVGLRGVRAAAYSVCPDVCIAIDVAHATDYPTVNKSKYGDIHVGKGPVVPVGSDLTSSVQAELKQISQELGIGYQQLALAGPSGTDINAVQVTGRGCATGLISIPCRYMHTPVEVVSLTDIENTAQILAEFCKQSRC